MSNLLVILIIQTHLPSNRHDGGLNVKVYLNDKLVCTSEAVYGGAEGETAIDGQKWETITSYKPCLEPIPLKVGDVLMMTSDYDLTKHRL
jgi:hypothetical protein